MLISTCAVSYIFLETDWLARLEVLLSFLCNVQYAATALNSSLDFTESWNYTLTGLAPTATYGFAADSRAMAEER